MNIAAQGHFHYRSEVQINNSLLFGGNMQQEMSNSSSAGIAFRTCVSQSLVQCHGTFVMYNLNKDCDCNFFTLTL